MSAVIVSRRNHPLVVAWIMLIYSIKSSWSFSPSTFGGGGVSSRTTKHHFLSNGNSDSNNENDDKVSSSMLTDDELLSSDEKEIIQLLRGPIGNQAAAAANGRLATKTIFVLSDATCATAKSVIEKSLKQFNGCDERFAIKKTATDDDDDCEVMYTKLFPFCREEQEVANVIKKAAAEQDALVVFTLASPSVRENASRMCELEGLVYLDLLGPTFSTMSTFFKRQPSGLPEGRDQSSPRRPRALSDKYYRRIEAVEFTLKADDGQAPWLLAEADVVIVGVSRTGKTPLSIVLSQNMGLKVANVPLVQEVAPPRELIDDVDGRRVFCLTLNAGELHRIRKNRLKKELEEMENLSNYADRKYLMNDLMSARRLADDNGWTEVDVTGRAVEETSSYITSLLNERFVDIANGIGSF